jgi:hypothetical protein
LEDFDCLAYRPWFRVSKMNLENHVRTFRNSLHCDIN